MDILQALRDAMAGFSAGLTPPLLSPVVNDGNDNAINLPRTPVLASPCNPNDPCAFDGPDDLEEAIAALAPALAVSLDLETTALTPWAQSRKPAESKKLGGGLSVGRYRREFSTTFSATPRARILSFSVEGCDRAFAFDLDRLDAGQRIGLVGALDDKIWIGHNLRFDYMWLRAMHPSVRPKLVLDAMLMASHLTPHLRSVLEDWLLGGNLYTKFQDATVWALPARSHDIREHVRAALLSKKRADANGSNASATTGVSLDLLSSALLGHRLTKSYQAAENWMPAQLTRGHYEYCVGDTAQPLSLVRLLLGLPRSSAHAEVMNKLVRHPGYPSYQSIALALTPLIQMQFNGLHLDTAQAEIYRRRKLDDATAAWSMLESMDARFSGCIQVTKDDGRTKSLNMREQFLQSGGIPAPLVELLGKALHDRAPDVNMPRTASGQLATGAKTLIAAFGGTDAAPVVAAFNEARAAMSAARSALQYLVAADTNGRLHASVSPTAVTGRTRSQNPNVQNPPSGQDFRALFTASAGNVIIAADYSAVEMRIAAALAARAYTGFRKLLALAQTEPDKYAQRIKKLGNIAWLLGAPGGHDHESGDRALVDKINDLCKSGQRPADAPCRTPKPEVGHASIADWGAHHRGELFAVIERMHAAGAFMPAPDTDALVMRDAFAASIDIHSVTAAAMMSKSGELDLQQRSPLDFLRTMSPADRAVFKETHKAARQKSKAVGFGLLYGMQADTLHTYGVESYRLSWTRDEAKTARGAFFELYPEILLWHQLSASMHFKARELDAWRTAALLDEDQANLNEVDPGAQREVPTGPAERKMFIGRTLSGRHVASSNRSAILNYQDQGTGAEIAMSVLARLITVTMPDRSKLADYLVNFVHDEFVLEVPIDFSTPARDGLERVMREAHDALLLKWGVICDLEIRASDRWTH